MHLTPCAGTAMPLARRMLLPLLPGVLPAAACTAAGECWYAPKRSGATAKSAKRYGRAAAGACKEPCPGNRKQKCGGSWALNLYQLKKN